jgi:hypothetical protein
MTTRRAPGSKTESDVDRCGVCGAPRDDADNECDYCRSPMSVAKPARTVARTTPVALARADLARTKVPTSGVTTGGRKGILVLSVLVLLVFGLVVSGVEKLFSIGRFAPPWMGITITSCDQSEAVATVSISNPATTPATYHVTIDFNGVDIRDNSVRETGKSTVTVDPKATTSMTVPGPLGTILNAICTVDRPGTSKS